MSASLVEHIADTLDCTEDEARSRLDAAVADLKHRAEAGEEVDIPGLGVFTMDDTLRFTPEASLARTVNHRFSGLTPVSVSGSGSAPEKQEASPEDTEVEEPPEAEPEDAAEDPAPSAPAFAEDEPADDEWQPPEPDDTHHPLGPKDEPPYEEPEHTVLDDASDEPPSGELENEPDEAPAAEEADLSTSPPMPSTKESEREAPPEASPPAEFDESETRPERAPVPDETPDEKESAAPVDEPSTEAPVEASDKKSEPEDTPIGATATGDGDTLSEWPDETDEPESESEAPSEAERADRSARSHPERDRGSGARIVIGLLLLIVLAGGGWYLLQQQGLFSGSGGSDVSTPSAATTQSETDPSASDEASDVQADSPSEETSPPDDNVDEAGEESAEAATDASASGASDLQIDPAAGGYTIVVASRAEREPAEALLDTYRDQFQDEGLPVSVLPGESDGQTRYRVGVGQFPSIEAATQNLEELADQLPEGAWVYRVSPNS